MPKQLKQHQPVGEDFLQGAKNTPQVIHHFPFPASAVWAALLDAKAWTEWLPITKVTWTSPEPFQVGTTRTVEMGKQVIEETFFAWEAGRRMAFRFERSSLPFSAAVENYEIVDVEGGCELHWSGRVSGFLLGPIMNRLFPRSLKTGLPRLEALIAEQPARFGLEEAP